jgi:hypothetical protein
MRFYIKQVLWMMNKAAEGCCYFNRPIDSNIFL